MIIAVPLILLWRTNYSALKTITLDNARHSMISDLSNKALSLDFALETVTKFGSAESVNAELTGLLERYLDTSGEERTYVRSLITIHLQKETAGIPAIQSIYIVIEDGDLIITTIPVHKEVPVSSDLGRSIYDSFENYYAGRVIWISDPVEENPPARRLSYCRPVTIGNGESRPRCSLVCNLNTDYVDALIGSSPFENNSLAITDFWGNVMLSSGYMEISGNISKNPYFTGVFTSKNREGSYLQTENRQEDLVCYYTSMNTMWKYIGTTPLDDIYGTTASDLTTLPAAILLAVGTAFLGALIVSWLVMNPVNRMLSSMRGTEQGNFSLVSGYVPNNEMGVMIERYNSMVVHLQELIDRVYVQELLRQESQLKSLQSQLDEHFLYNTLNTIYCVAKQGESDNAARMIMMLSRYFRTSLSEGHDYIRISELVVLLKSYLSIQQTRYGDRMKVNFSVDPELQDYYVIKYLFQPIVENAIVYGVESKVGQCTIDITMQKQGDLLFFRTKDNGTGIAPETLASLQESLKSREDVIGKSFALRNINRQIELAYGGEYCLNIESEFGEGTEVSFSIPLKEDSGNE